MDRRCEFSDKRDRGSRSFGAAALAAWRLCGTARAQDVSPDEEIARRSFEQGTAAYARQECQAAIAAVRTRADVFVGADDRSRPRGIDWAVLMKRAYAVDLLTCPRCAGPRGRLPAAGGFSFLSEMHFILTTDWKQPG